MMSKLPPRPVNVPPTEVARREPRAVVMISVSVSFAGLMRVRGNIRRYDRRTHQGAAIIAMLARQIRPSSSRR